MAKGIGRPCKGWLIALSWLLPATAAAETLPGFEIGPEAYYYAYREPNFANQIGPYLAANGSYTWTVGSAFLTTNVIGGVGYLNYKSNGTGRLNGKWDFTGDFRVLGGADWLLFDGFYVSPYVGFGYRVLFDQGRDLTTTTGSQAYDRLSQYFYLPIGLGFSVRTGDWVLRPSAEYDLFLNGKQTSYFAALGANGDVTNKQTHGYGARATFLAEAPVSWGRIAFGPFVRYWNIGDSEPKIFTVSGVAFEGTEPHNNTLEAGMTVRFRF